MQIAPARPPTERISVWGSVIRIYTYAVATTTHTLFCSTSHTHTHFSRVSFSFLFALRLETLSLITWLETQNTHTCVSVCVYHCPQYLHTIQQDRHTTIIYDDDVLILTEHGFAKRNNANFRKLTDRDDEFSCVGALVGQTVASLSMSESRYPIFNDAGYLCVCFRTMRVNYVYHRNDSWNGYDAAVRLHFRFYTIDTLVNTKRMADAACVL